MSEVVSTGSQPVDSLNKPAFLVHRVSTTVHAVRCVLPSNQIDEVIAAAKRAKEAGSTRFCMGAAWRELGNKKKAFNNILDMVSNRVWLWRIQ